MNFKIIVYLTLLFQIVFCSVTSGLCKGCCAAVEIADRIAHIIRKEHINKDSFKFCLETCNKIGSELSEAYSLDHPGVFCHILKDALDTIIKNED